MRADHHELPTPRTTLRARYVRVLVWCKSCRHRRDADLQALVDAGRGDVPLVELRLVLELRQRPHGFRGDGDRGDGPATVIVLWAGRRWPCVLGTVWPAFRVEAEACPPRRSEADVASGRTGQEQSGAVRFAAERLRSAEMLARLGRGPMAADLRRTASAGLRHSRLRLGKRISLSGVALLGHWRSGSPRALAPSPARPRRSPQCPKDLGEGSCVPGTEAMPA